MVWRDVVYDVWTILKQNFDDGELTLGHASYWCSIYGNRLLSQHIEKRDSGAFVTVYRGLPVIKDNTYKYLELPQNIFDFNTDDGVEYMSYNSDIDACDPPFTSAVFTRTTPAGARRLYYTEEETPKPNNPYFYRINNRLYLLGLENINKPIIEAGFYQTIPSRVEDMSDEFPFPDELIMVLQKHVFDLGRFVLIMPTDRTNDGAIEEKNMTLPKMTSVATDDGSTNNNN